MDRRSNRRGAGCCGLAAVLGLWISGGLVAGDEVDIASVLRQPIIAPELPLSEVERYAEARVPPMPLVKTVEEWERRAEQLRLETLEAVVFRGEAQRWRDAPVDVKWLETVAGGPGYRIRKLRYEVLPGMWVPALLYEPEKLEGKVPVILNVNGHDGKGKAAPYKQIRCINQAKRGMLALNTEWLGMGQLRGEGFVHYRMNQLDLCGTSGLAPFFLAMKRALDLLLARPHADPRRVGVAGLSGGGWQTILISSLDRRVTLANPVAGYSSFRTRARHVSDLGDSEQTPNDLATVLDYTHLTALRAPRPTLLTYNARDNCCFRADHALGPLLEAARPVFALYEKEDRLRSHVNHDPGNHNFERENREVFYRMLGDHFAEGGATFDAEEIPSEGELKSAEELHVALPERNSDFHSLALALSRGLPRRSTWPENRQEALQWQETSREKLRELVRFKSYAVTVEEKSRRQEGDLSARFWRFRMGDEWTVPAVELTRGTARSTAIVVADGGRSNAVDQVSRLLGNGKRVLAVDPFYFGESKIVKRDYLFALLVAAVGDRPLGLQASQLAAIARWVHAQRVEEAVSVVALGPRTSTVALVAAAIETTIEEVELFEPLGSLKEVIESNWSVDRYPELFCFGLLEHFDVKDLVALLAPRRLKVRRPGDRVRSELGELDSWYGRWGAAFEAFE